MDSSVRGSNPDGKIPGRDLSDAGLEKEHRGMVPRGAMVTGGA
jgi:hypothetical protein